MGTCGVGTLLLFYLLGPGVGKELKDHERPVETAPLGGLLLDLVQAGRAGEDRPASFLGRGGHMPPSRASCRKGKRLCPLMPGSDFVAFTVSLIKI